jgi:hypothetical protein
MADNNMSIEKKEPEREGSDDSMDSTPEAEMAGAPKDTAGQPKRKGGRKPVRFTATLCYACLFANILHLTDLCDI